MSTLLHVADDDIDDGSGDRIMHPRGETNTVQCRCNDQVSSSKSFGRHSLEHTVQVERLDGGHIADL